MTYALTASIVTYNNNREVLLAAINSFLRTALPVRLYLVDNSPSDALKDISTDARVTYIFNNRNVGFGAGHNIALKNTLHLSAYHLVLNPDVYFVQGTLETLYAYMQSSPDVGLVMPKVLYPDGSTQHLCKLLPTPYDLVLRRFMKWDKARLEKRTELFELRFTGYDKEMEVPYLSGCFMFLRTEALQRVGLFDERIFMYTEDADLSRRVHQHYRTVYYPKATIYHHFAKGSHINKRLLWYAIHGNCVYFNKWGWFHDKERDAINKKTLAKLNS